MKAFKQSGFSLVQVLIAMGLMAAVSVALMKQQDTSSKMQSKMGYNHDVNTIATTIQSILANDKSCTATLLNAPFGSQFTEIKRVRRDPDTGLDLPAETAFDTTRQIANNLYIESMKFTADPWGQDVVKVKFQPKRSENGLLVKKTDVLGGNDIEKSFALNVQKDSSGNFVKCFSVEGEVLQSILNSLPSCIMTEEACSGAYAYQNGTQRFEVILQERRSCVGTYRKKTCGFGDVSPKTCYCSDGPACTCTTEHVTCFDREMQPCQKDNVTKIVTNNRCCQEPPVVVENPSPIGGAGGAGGGSGCFVAGTPIQLFSGETKNIEDVEVGDELIDGSGKKVVAKKLVRYPFKGRIYSINGSEYFFTPNHPFKSLTGWKSLDPVTSSRESEIEVSLLRVGDVLVKKDGLELVASLDFVETEEPVYNFEVTDSHEYIARDFVVHNLKEKMKEMPME